MKDIKITFTANTDKNQTVHTALVHANTVNGVKANKLDFVTNYIFLSENVKHLNVEMV